MLALITGASSGIGLMYARELASQGHDLIIVSNQEKELEEVRSQLIEQYGVKVWSVYKDLTDEHAAEELHDYCLEQNLEVDILINNAGIMDDMSPIGDATDEKYEQVMKVNVYGPMTAMRKAVNVMKAQDTKGSIVNVASVGGMRTCAGAIYCASKAALISMTKNTAYMYMPDGIRCNAIAPGGIATEISSSMGMPNMAGYGRVQTVLGCSPAPGTSEEIAAAALFLASDEASYVNGVILPVDGGWMAS